MPRNKNRRYSGRYTDTKMEAELTQREDFHCYYDPLTERVIIFMDADSFDNQVRGRQVGLSPETLKTEPFITRNQSNVITAVNYPAKAYGITRQCTVKQALQLCPHLRILSIPNHYGKPDNLETTRASDDIYDSIVRSLQRQSKTLPLPIIEKASKDEFYIDISEEVHRRVFIKGMLVPPTEDIESLKNIKGFLETPRYTAKGENLIYQAQKVQNNAQEAVLIHGAVIARIILEDIKKDTSFTLSAGVASNKLLAKIGRDLHKPDGITILPHVALPRVSRNVKIESVRGLGGSTGKKIKKRLGIKTMFQLGKVDKLLLQMASDIGEDGLLFHDLAVGKDEETVKAKKFNDTLNCGITFTYGGRMMFTIDDLYENLWNRFLEMEDHINYSFNRHGSERIPEAFILKVFTIDRKLPFGFKETVDDHLIEYIEGKLCYVGQSPWDTLHDKYFERFRSKINCDCEFNLNFKDDKKIVCRLALKVSAIKLVAVFARH